MATVTGMTAAAMQAIRDGTVVSAAFDSANHLILTKHDGTTVDGGALGAATTTLAGPVALATNAQTQSGSSTNLAVTPAGLASLPGYRVQILADNAVSESATPASYPFGTSLMSAGTGSGWSINGGFGAVVTHNLSTSRTAQTFYENSGGTVPTKAWVREYNSAVGGGGWTTWAQMMLMVQLVPASFVQTTTKGNYPAGMSRLYYTTSTSASWDFTGMAGEVITYLDAATDFGRQIFTQHVGGLTLNPAVWSRTATGAGGWSKWTVMSQDDTGWVNLTITGTGYVQKRQMAVRKKNGVVYFKGAATIPSGGYTLMLVVPAAYRPAEDKNIPVTINSTVTMSGSIEAATGNISTWSSATTTAWFTLDGFNYPLG
jgi:hypothetical protein